MRKLSLKCWKNNEGTTMLEALVALAIVAIAVSAFSGFLVRSIAAFSQASSSVRESAALSDLDRSLRDMAGRVMPPFWARTFKESIVPGGFQFPYFDGSAEKFFTVTVDTASITLRGAEGQRRFRLPESAAAGSALVLDTIKDGEGRPVGVSVKISGKGEDSVILARFGSFPVGKAAP